MDLLSDLNEPQREAVMHINGPLLVLAGAGSGKTRVITRRVAYLVKQGIAPWNVLALTFTNKAAGEMRQRVEDLGTPRGTTVCTFHALCARLLREFAVEAGLSQNYTIYDRGDQLKIVKQAMEKLELPSDRLPPAGVHAAISNSKNELVTAETFANQAGDFYTRNVAKVFMEYERQLKAANALDFDDLLVKMAFLMRDRGDIRELLGQRYQYVLIDEYQDTNHAQYLLAHGIGMQHENICATGDPDQSIYAWRGADIHNILDFEKDYPNAKVVRLEENYRSTAPILAAASTLIAHNTQRKDKKLWTRREGGQQVHVVVCDDEHAEAQQVIGRINKARAAGREYNDMAIFYRVNSLSRVLEDALFRGGIPYRVARGVEFYNRKEIKDVLAYLKLLNNPLDDLSCERVINTPPRGIGAATVTRLAQAGASRGLGLLDACNNPELAALGAGAAKKVWAFAQMMASLGANLDRPVKDVVSDVVKETGLEAALGDTDEEDAQARANVEELINSAAEFDENNPDGRLGEYLHQVSLVSDVDRLEGEAGGAVTLMTLHAAKGLEFPVVFVIGWEEGLLPFYRGEPPPGGQPSKRPQGDENEEERRLAFVGMTRAREELTLTCARFRMVRGRSESRVSSPFLTEIGRDAVSVEDVTLEGRWQRQPRVPSRAGGFYDDVSERRLIEQIAQDDGGFPSEYEYLREGCRVRHEKFGAGKVTRVRMPWPETRVEVVFDGFGPKTLVLRHTKLEVL